MSSPLTMFGTVKPVRGAARIAQQNALRTWRALSPDIDVILIGDDDGAKDLAGTVGCRFVPTVKRSPLGIPLLDDLFRIGQTNASSGVCLFANTDLLFLDDLLPAVEAVTENIHGPFLMVGQRWDLDLGTAIDFHDARWRQRLVERRSSDGVQDAPGWVDWFGFRTGQFMELPPFVVGRPGYDHWLVAHSLTSGIPVVDATRVVRPIHQHHEYRGGQAALWSNSDSLNNVRLIGDRRNRRTISNATWMLTEDLSVVPAQGVKYRMGQLHAALGPAFDRTLATRQRIGLTEDGLYRIGRRGRALVQRR